MAQISQKRPLLLSNNQENGITKMQTSSLFLNLHKVYVELSGLIRSRLSENSPLLKAEQLPVLMAISVKSGLNTSQQDIANYLKRDKSSIQRTLTNMVKVGIVNIIHHPEDKRKNVVVLSRQGQVLADRICKELDTLEHYLFNDFNNYEKTILVKLLKKTVDCGVN